MLVKSPISEKWFIVTKYKWINEEKGSFEAKEKFDITNQIQHYFGDKTEEETRLWDKESE